MNIKSLLLCILAFAMGTAAIAQDKIFKKNGEIIDAKVRAVTSATITYKRADNTDGPDYLINKVDVTKIVYENGTEDIYTTVGKDANAGTTYSSSGKKISTNKKPKKIVYNRNIVALAPLQFSAKYNNVAAEAGIGIGLSYERPFGRKGVFNFYVPAIVSFNIDESSVATSTGTGSTHGFDGHSFYISPGVKIYPTGSFGKVRYAVGPALAIEGGKSTITGFVTDPNGIVHEAQIDENVFAMGVLLNNSLNLNPTPHFYMSIELGIGVSFINKANSVEQGTAEMEQLSFRIGYRF